MCIYINNNLGRKNGKKKKTDSEKIKESIQEKKDSATNINTIETKCRHSINTSLQTSVQSKIKYYTTPLEEDITELKQENKELKGDIKELKSQNQELQNKFNLLLKILSQQNTKLNDQLQRSFGASDDISKQTGKGKRHTFSN